MRHSYENFISIYFQEWCDLAVKALNICMQQGFKNSSRRAATPAATRRSIMVSVAHRVSYNIHTKKPYAVADITARNLKLYCYTSGSYKVAMSCDVIATSYCT